VCDWQRFANRSDDWNVCRRRDVGNIALSRFCPAANVTLGRSLHQNCFVIAENRAASGIR
jgi:hypothetical protein